MSRRNRRHRAELRKPEYRPTPLIREIIANTELRPAIAPSPPNATATPTTQTAVPNPRPSEVKPAVKESTNGTPTSRKDTATAAASAALVYTVKELAHALSVSRATIDRLDAQGKLPGRIKIGQQVRYVRYVVQHWLLQQAKDRQDGNNATHGGSNQPNGPVHGTGVQTSSQPDGIGVESDA